MGEVGQRCCHLSLPLFLPPPASSPPPTNLLAVVHHYGSHILRQNVTQLCQRLCRAAGRLQLASGQQRCCRGLRAPLASRRRRRRCQAVLLLQPQPGAELARRLALQVAATCAHHAARHGCGQ